MNLALAALAALLAFATPAAAQQIPRPSGMPWASGASAKVEFGDWRGRPLDARTAFPGKRDWNHLRNSMIGRPTPGVVMALGFPMLPETARDQLEQCGAGAFDANMRTVVNQMIASGWTGSYVRLGWEMNRVDRSRFPWAAPANGEGAAWVACFRRWVDIFNPVDGAGVRQKRFPIVWNPANQGTFPAPIERLYPGNDVVDVVGSQFYDRCPTSLNETEFQARVNIKDKWGNPSGPRAWLEYARTKGKKWALPEWGVGGSQTACNKPGFDNPWFIARMHTFLRTWKADVAFESYFNGTDGPTGDTILWPDGSNPNAAAKYRELW